MAKDRTQLNINIDPELLLELKSQAIKAGKTLTEYVTNQLKNTIGKNTEDFLEERLLRIEEKLGIDKNLPVQKKYIGVIFTDEGAKEYGEVAKKLFDSHLNSRGISIDKGLQELAVHLNNYSHSNPELVFNILLGNHALTGLEMTNAYRRGSCAMRTALSDWCNDPLEPLNEAFLSAVITKSLT